MAKYEALRGMDDILSPEIEKWQWLEEKARCFFESRGFKEIRTPILEYTDLFVRSVGESSDIVHKEMFSFEDRGGRQVTMRPELTASIARATLEKSLLKQAKSLRFYYIAPMFRAERPQAGRKRQFHQIGVEIINESGVPADFECITLLYAFLKYVGLEAPRLRLNDLGSAQNLGETADRLKDYFQKEKSKLCKDCQWRLEKNVLRIFDCKTESCQPVIDQAPWEKISPLSESFEQLTSELKADKIDFEVKRRLVRGLDYYNGAVFEVAAEGLGAQDAVAGGGRYDRLYEQLGGTQTPCTGFSIGMERLLVAIDQKEKDLASRLQTQKVYVAALDAQKQVLKVCQELALNLREQGFRIETSPGETSLSKHLKKANKLNVHFVVMVGAEEVQKKTVTLKDMQQKTQQALTSAELITYLRGVTTL